MQWPGIVVIGATLITLTRAASAQGVSPRTAADTNPESVVQRQVDAYNARDLDAFVKLYSESAMVRAIDAPDSLAVRGRQAIRQSMTWLLQAPREFHVEI